MDAFPLFLAYGMPGAQELLVILLIVLVLFGAKKLPGLARGLGSSIGEFRKARKEFDDAASEVVEVVSPSEPQVAKVSRPVSKESEGPVSSVS